MSPVNHFTTTRLSLRRFSPNDVAAFHAILSDPAAMEFWSTPPHATMAETKTWISSSICSFETGQADEFVLEHMGRVIGKVGLWRPHELGLILAPSHWGRGFAAEACGAVIGRAFLRGVPFITADVDPRNTRCLRLLDKLGFRETHRAKATCKVGDQWVDSVYLELRSPNSQPPSHTSAV